MLLQRLLCSFLQQFIPAFFTLLILCFLVWLFCIFTIFKRLFLFIYITWCNLTNSTLIFDFLNLLLLLLWSANSYVCNLKNVGSICLWEVWIQQWVMVRYINFLSSWIIFQNASIKTTAWILSHILSWRRHSVGAMLTFGVYISTVDLNCINWRLNVLIWLSLCLFIRFLFLMLVIVIAQIAIIKDIFLFYRLFWLINLMVYKVNSGTNIGVLNVLITHFYIIVLIIFSIGAFVAVSKIIADLLVREFEIVIYFYIAIIDVVI